MKPFILASRRFISAHPTRNSLRRPSANNVASSNLATSDIAHDRKGMEIAIDLQWKAITQLADVLSKGVNFYFLIVAASVTLLFQVKLIDGQARVVVALVIVITIMVVVLVAMGIWLLSRKMRRIKTIFGEYNPDLSLKLFPAAGISATSSYSAIALALCCTIILLLAGAIALILLPK